MWQLARQRREICAGRRPTGIKKSLSWIWWSWQLPADCRCTPPRRGHLVNREGSSRWTSDDTASEKVHTAAEAPSSARTSAQSARKYPACLSCESKLKEKAIIISLKYDIRSCVKLAYHGYELRKIQIPRFIQVSFLHYEPDNPRGYVVCAHISPDHGFQLLIRDFPISIQIVLFKYWLPVLKSRKKEILNHKCILFLQKYC